MGNLGWLQVTGDLSGHIQQREILREAFFRAEDSGDNQLAERLLKHLTLQSQIVRLYESGARYIKVNYDLNAAVAL